MNLAQLEAFLILGEELHFGRAAARLSTSTPNLSKRIAEFERELGVSLFNRSSRQVSLAPAGAILLDTARRAATELRTLKSLASHAATGRAGTIHLVYSDGNGEIIAKLISRLRSSALFVDVTLEQLTSTQVIDAVLNGRATVGVCRDLTAPGLTHLTMARSLLDLVAMPPEHRLSEKATIDLDDLAGETFIHADLTSRRLTDPSALRLAGAQVDLRYERVRSETEIIDLVARGFGLLLMTDSLYKRYRRSDIVVRRLTTIPVGSVQEDRLIWRMDNDSPLVAVLVDIARSCCEP